MLPQVYKCENLELKRGAPPQGSQIISWCKEIVDEDFNQQIEPKDITVSLLHPEGAIIMSWYFDNAYLIKWNVSEFNSEDNIIAVETIELAYRYFTPLHGEQT